MRFLCVACDEAMTLQEARGPDDGSMTVLFRCPACGTEVAMLTNAMETQMVRSLGVKIGGRAAPAEPMETIRTTLVHRREDAPAPEAPAAAPEPAGAPQGGSRCPFTGAVAEAFARQAQPRWSEEAEARIARIPAAVQPMVRQGVEQYARERGYAEITGSVMDEVRGGMGM